MKRYIGKLGAALFLFCMFVSGCAELSASIELRPIAAPQQGSGSGKGNSNANLINGGLAASGDSEFYYVSSSRQDTGIFARDYAGTYRKKLSGDRAAYLNAAGEWLYYQNLSDKGRIYRIHVEKGTRERIGEEFATALVWQVDRLFFINQDDNAVIGSRNSDGSRYVKLWDGAVSYLNVWNGQLYFAAQDAIMAINTDGTGVRVVAASNGVYSMVVDQGEIYWIDRDFALHTIKVDGADERILASSVGHAMALDDRFVYFKQTDNLVKMPREGGAVETIAKLAVFEHPQIVGANLLFSGHPDLNRPRLRLLPFGEQEAVLLE